MSSGDPISNAYDVAALAAASGVIASSPDNTIRGFALGSFGGTCRLRIREKNVTGKILIPLNIADGETVGAERLALRCDGPVYVQFVSGAANLEGSIWVG